MPAQKPDELVEAQQPFSDLMLRWLAEGDGHELAGGDRHGSASAREDVSHLSLIRVLGPTRESQRHRVLLASAAFVSLGLIVTAHRYAEHATHANDIDSIALRRSHDPVPAGPPSPITRRPAEATGAQAGVSAVNEVHHETAADPGKQTESPLALRGENSRRACRMAVARDRAREALRECAAAVEEDPNSASTLVLLARANLLGGREAESLRLAQHALTIDARLAEGYLLVGSVQQTTGHADSARSAYETYLRLSPTGRHAAEVRAVLLTL